MQKQADAVPGLCVADRYEPTCFEELTQALTTIINIVGPIYIWLRGWYKGHFSLGGTRLG